MNHQEPKRQDSAFQNLEALRQHIHGIHMAILTTRNEDGSLHSRPMTLQNIDDDGNLWFFAAANSQRTLEVQHEPWVNVAFSKSDSSLYVSISGRAELVHDSVKIRELWNPMVTAYFPNGHDDPNLVLLKVKIHDAEIWDSPSSPVVRLFNVFQAVATGTRDDQGQHERIDLSHRT